MGSIVAKIMSIIEAKNLNKTKFAQDIEVSRDTVYNLSDENIKVATLLKISKVLTVPLSEFLEEVKELSYQVAEEPNSFYTKKNANFTDKMELGMLRDRVKDLETIVKLQSEELKRCKEEIKRFTSKVKPR